MRLWKLFVVLVMAAAACSRPTAIAAVPSTGVLSRGVVDPYLSVDSALASDRIEGVKANASAISVAARALGPDGVKIDTAAAQLASATDLADARAKFGVLSDTIDRYMSSRHLAPPAGVRVAWCPMAMRPWLQNDGALRNPYYGSQMLTCGSFRN